MSEDDKKIKVTDKRMFTATGDLREEFRDLDDPSKKPTPAPEAPSPAPTPSPDPLVGRDAPAETREEFLMLVDLLAQGAVYHLQQSQVAGPEMQQSLEIARQHVDLLTVLRDKTEGNLSAEEKGALDDTLYRLRMAVVDKRG